MKKCWFGKKYNIVTGKEAYYVSRLNSAWLSHSSFHCWQLILGSGYDVSSELIEYVCCPGPILLPCLYGEFHPEQLVGKLLRQLLASTIVHNAARNWTHWPGGQYLPFPSPWGGQEFYTRNRYLAKIMLSIILWGEGQIHIGFFI